MEVVCEKKSHASASRSVGQSWCSSSHMHMRSSSHALCKGLSFRRSHCLGRMERPQANRADLVTAWTSTYHDLCGHHCRTSRSITATSRIQPVVHQWCSRSCLPLRRRSPFLLDGDVTVKKCPGIALFSSGRNWFSVIEPCNWRERRRVDRGLLKLDR